MNYRGLFDVFVCLHACCMMYDGFALHNYGGIKVLLLLLL